jgi:hypothetical protein
MYGKTLIKIEKPKTQALDAVKALLAWKGHPINPLPADVSLENGRLVLVLSNKKDAYYTVTSRDCSCLASAWHPGQRCKHRRKYFPEAKATAKPAAIGSHGAFKPFLESDAGPAKVSSSPLSAIDCHDTSDMDVAYHSIKADREMWPLCEA